MTIGTIETIRVHRFWIFRWATRSLEPVLDLPAIARAAGGI